MSRPLGAHALAYAVRGWAVFPLLPRDKKPRIPKSAGGNGCHDATTDADTVMGWWAGWPDSNIGLHCGPASGVFVLDVDAEAPEDGGLTGPDALVLLDAAHGALPETLTATTGGGGEHRYFVMPPGRTIRNRARIKVPDGRRAALDVRAEGGYVVLPPSIHPSGAVYRWAGSVRDPAEAPGWLLDLLDPPRPARPPLVSLPPLSDHVGAYGATALQSAASAILGSTESQRHDTIYREAAAIGELVGGGVLGREEAEAALVAAGEAVGKSYKEVVRTVSHALDRGMTQPRRPPERPSREKRREAWEDGPPAWMEGAPPVIPPEEPPPTEPYSEPDEPPDPAAAESAPPNRTDLGNAQVFLSARGEDWRWCSAMMGTGWLRWDGSRWASDGSRRLTREVSEVVPTAWRAMADAIGEVKATSKAGKRQAAMRSWADRCESAGSVRSAIDLAGAHNAVDRERWDADEMLFSAPNLTLDLRRGLAYAPRREDYITHQAGHGITVRAPCPTWTAFLSEIMDGDAEMVAYLQRCVGYCLTGSTAEQCMFICYGRGANGKSTFMEIVRYILGDYARNTPVETFVDRRAGGIPNDLAALAGARLVTCSEPPEGGALNEALVKLATGDDVISARFLNREFFDYIPRFKLWMLTNHRPIVRGTDNGVWRRLRLIPFSVTIPIERQDRDLLKKLRAEAGGILQWAVDGCADWRVGGLRPPERVLLATQQYRADMDIVAAFLEARCELSSVAVADNADLYRAFRSWCVANGERERSHRWLSQRLTDKGYRQAATRSTGRSWAGIAIIPEPAESGRIPWDRRDLYE